jgi:hypothetical protein
MPVDGVARRGSASATGNFAPEPTPTYKDSARHKNRDNGDKMRPKSRSRPKSRFFARRRPSFRGRGAPGKKRGAWSPWGGRVRTRHLRRTAP